MTKISFKLPKYSLANIKLVGQVKKGLDSIDPILSQIKTYPVAHGGKIRQVSEPKMLETPMKNYSILENLEPGCFLKTDWEDFATFLYNLCESLNSEMKRSLFAEVSDITDATGNIISTTGLTTWQSYLKTLKQWKIQFDEDGKPCLDDLGIYNGQTYEKIDVSPKTTEQTNELESVIEAKRKEYYAQKRIRRLS